MADSDSDPVTTHKLALYAYLRHTHTWVSPEHARSLWGEIYPEFGAGIPEFGATGDDPDCPDLFRIYLVRSAQYGIPISADNARAFLRAYSEPAPDSEPDPVTPPPPPDPLSG